MKTIIAFLATLVFFFNLGPQVAMAGSSNDPKGLNPALAIDCSEGQADLDESGAVGFNDLSLLLSSWNQSDFDIDGDGVVGFSDLDALLSCWGEVPPDPGPGEAVYISPTTGNNANSGADWNNAKQSLPFPLERGKTYFLADGSYGDVVIGSSQVQSGSQEIQIVKATQASHGTDAGWQANLGDSQATFVHLKLNGVSNMTFDGQENFGIEIANQSGFEIVQVQHSDNITFNQIEIDGEFEWTGGETNYTSPNGTNFVLPHGVGGCFAISDKRSQNLTLKNSWIHDISEDGFLTRHGSGYQGDSGLILENNTWEHFYGCGNIFCAGCNPNKPPRCLNANSSSQGIPGACHNGHSDAVQISNIDDVILRGNFIHDVHGNSAFYIHLQGTASGQPSARNVLLENNIFYTPEAASTTYFLNSRNVRLFNNIIAKGFYNSISVGNPVEDLYVYNNIIHQLAYQWGGGYYDFNPSEEHYHHNIFLNVQNYASGDWPGPSSGTGNLVVPNGLFANPLIEQGEYLPNLTREDFFPVSTSPAIDSGYSGDANLSIPLQDIFGESRFDEPSIGNTGSGNQGPFFDRGAIEY